MSINLKNKTFSGTISICKWVEKKQKTGKEQQLKKEGQQPVCLQKKKTHQDQRVLYIKSLKPLKRLNPYFTKLLQRKGKKKGRFQTDAVRLYNCGSKYNARIA